MRVIVLASGSGGNACVVDAGGTRLLVDGGVAPRTLARALAWVGVPRVDGVLVTHAHGDHVGHAARIAAQRGLSVHATEATRRAASLDPAATTLFSPREPFELGALRVVPCPVPHDQAQVALRFEHAGRSAALVTDLGEPTGALLDHLAGVELLLVEANHDLELLRRGSYPEALKRRVASSQGHLSNEQCAALVRRVGAPTVALMHLSHANNRPELARAVVASARPEAVRGAVVVAPRRGVLALTTRAEQTTLGL